MKASHSYDGLEMDRALVYEWQMLFNGQLRGNGERRRIRMFTFSAQILDINVIVFLLLRPYYTSTENPVFVVNIRIDMRRHNH